MPAGIRDALAVGPPRQTVICRNVPVEGPKGWTTIAGGRNALSAGTARQTAIYIQNSFTSPRSSRWAG